MSNQTNLTPSGMRRLTVVGFIAVVAVYLIVVQGVGLWLKPDGFEYGELPDVSSVWRTITVPVALSVLFGALVVTFLRWWKPVMKDDRPVATWVRVVPALLIVSIVATTGYANLSEQPADLVLLLLVSTLLLGVGEELMFRGIGVNVFRNAGFTEGRVALWTSIIFGAVHMTNIFTEGPSAFMQAAVVSVTGYFLYLTRRSFGTLLAPMLIHGLYDFSIFSHAIGNTDAELGAQQAIPLLVGIVLAIIVFPRLKKIEPEDRDPSVRAPSRTE